MRSEPKSQVLVQIRVKEKSLLRLYVVAVVVYDDDDVGGGGACGFGNGGGASVEGAAASTAVLLVMVSILEGKKSTNQCPMSWSNVSNSLNNSDQRRRWVRM